MFTKDIAVDLATASKDELKKCFRLVPRMGVLIEKHLPLAKDPARNLYFYMHGKYHENGDLAVLEIYHKILDYLNERDEWNAAFESQLLKWLLVRANPLLDRPNLFEVNLKNGIYDWEQNLFKPHTSEYRTVVQLPFDYDANATCPAWDRFLTDILPGGERFLLELIGLCMIPHMGLQKCIVLFGDGSNGKSMFMKCLEAVIGSGNISNISLHALTDAKDRFSRSGLVGKLLNSYADLSDKELLDVSAFKTIIGEDHIMVEYKGKTAFRYLPFARLLFSANDKIRASDGSLGFKRRIIHVPFLSTFAVDPEKGEALRSSLTSLSEMSGLFNRVLPLLQNVVDSGFTISPEIAELIEMFTPIPETTKQWLQSNVVENPKGAIPSSAFYNLYCTHCPVTESVNQAKLNMYLKSLFPSVQFNKSARVGYSKTVTSCYRGITLTDQNMVNTIISSHGMKDWETGAVV